MVFESGLKRPLTYSEGMEEEIVREVEGAGGVISRVDLRRKVGGSNTTFAKKISSLKRKGVIEEFKREDGRLRTAYRFTQHYRHLSGLQEALKMENWFSASQNIELFPEFERIAQTLVGEASGVYKMLGIEPQHMLLETSLAVSNRLALKDEEVRDILSLCSAMLQNLVTGRLHPKFEDEVEGYILFHYKLEKPREELQKLLPECVMNYITSEDPLEQHRASSKLVELIIKHKGLPHALTMAAMNVAQAMKLDTELEDLARKYKSYREGVEPLQVTRMEFALVALNIFKKLYQSRVRKGEPL